MQTTLRLIVGRKPCERGLSRLLQGLGKNRIDDEPISLAKIYEINGFRDAVWALRAVEDLHSPETALPARMKIRLFLLEAADEILKLVRPTVRPHSTRNSDVVACVLFLRDGRTIINEVLELAKTSSTLFKPAQDNSLAHIVESLEIALSKRCHSESKLLYVTRGALKVAELSTCIFPEKVAHLMIEEALSVAAGANFTLDTIESLFEQRLLK